MKQLLFWLLFSLFFTKGVFCQTTISGRITDANGQGLAGANIFIKGSYDGGSSDTAGYYSFKTSVSGSRILVASFIGYTMTEKNVELVESRLTVNFTLLEKNDRIHDVVISAGTFQTSDQKKSVTLQPLDIVTTPSAIGDIYGALTSLPGTTAVGEDGRLFVRGGDGYESKTFIDGLLVKKPYSSTVPDLPTRGRFSPFLFSGTMFSTGGYSAEYGQALSSALILTTNSFPRKTQTEVSVMTVGAGATQTFKSENAAMSAGFEYYNLQPYFSIVHQDIDWKTCPRSLAGTFTARYRMKGDGMLKIFSNYKSGHSALIYPEMTSSGSVQEISLNDRSNYTNISYSGSAGKGWIVKSGVSFSWDDENMLFRLFQVNRRNSNVQGKIMAKKKFSKRLSFLIGTDEVYNYYHEKYTEYDGGIHSDIDFNDFNTSFFMEAEMSPFTNLALRTGLRNEYSSILRKNVTAFRGSLAWAFSRQLQTSFAYGSFYQTPEENLLRFTHELDFEKAQHFIANIQYEANDRIVRLEAYYKKYTGLVVYNEEQFYHPESYNNRGNGYSQGIDFFFRDRSSVSDMDFWFSYSFLDARRLYRNYPVKAVPAFSARHSVNMVAKKYIPSITTQFGAIFTWASGRPYNDPNDNRFMAGRTKDYSDVSINVSYLTTLFKQSAIIYSSLSNVFGRENIFGYRYYQIPDNQGRFDSIPVRPGSRRFFMIGLFLTI